MTTTQLPTYEKLTQPLTPMSWIKWGSAKLFLNTLGRLSQGIRVGFRNGFDSGVMLDYVYENKPRGQLVIGRMIDEFYLNSPGWIGIRQRKIHLKQTLHDIIRTHQLKSKKTVIMDMASGPGQYLIETLQEHPYSDLEVICRDLSEAGLKQGEEKARELGLKNIRYEKANAFDPSHFPKTDPQTQCDRCVRIVRTVYRQCRD